MMRVHLRTRTHAATCINYAYPHVRVHLYSLIYAHIYNANLSMYITEQRKSKDIIILFRLTLNFTKGEYF